jgi:hypothetical protein
MWMRFNETKLSVMGLNAQMLICNCLEDLLKLEDLEITSVSETTADTQNCAEHEISCKKLKQKTWR